MFIKQSLLPLFAVGMAINPLSASTADAHRQSDLVVGAGRAGIELPAGLLPMQGFGVEHDQLQARVLLLDDGKSKAAVVVLDMTSLSGGTIAQVREVVKEVAGVSPEKVLVVASHTFSAPHILPPGIGPAGHNQDEIAKTDRFAASLVTAVRQAVITAAKTARPATIGFAEGFSNVNVNRNVKTAKGWWLGAGESGPSDKSVLTLYFEDSTHHPIAVLANYAVQSAVMDQVIVANGKKAITADLAGAAMEYVERRLGPEVVSLFLTGSAGDQVPTYAARRHVLDSEGNDQIVDMGADAYPLIALQGERLGGAVLTSLSKQARVPSTNLTVATASIALAGQERPRDLTQIKPTLSYTYKIVGASEAPYTILSIGDVAIVGVQVELSSTTGAWIRAHSPFKHTLVATMVNGAAKYLPDEENYRNFSYEAMNSSYAPGSAEILAQAIIRSLKQISAR